MQQLEFFAAEKEISELVGGLLHMQCVLIPDSHYGSDSYAKVSEIAAVEAVALSVPHFFVIHEGLFESPLSMREVTAPDGRFFYIDPKTGGPSLQFYWGRHFEKDGRNHWSPSWISYDDWYESSVTGERRKVCKELLDIYFACAKMLRASFRKIKPGKREYLISGAAEEFVRTGGALVGLETLNADDILSTPKGGPRRA